MTRWMTAAEISETYRVGEAKLLRFAMRGNLATRLDGEGVRVFDLEGVERIFPPRNSEALAQRSTPHFGTLGALELGAPADRENRRVSRLPARVAREESERPKKKASGA